MQDELPLTTTENMHMQHSHDGRNLSLVSNEHGTFLELFNAMHSQVSDFGWDLLKPKSPINTYTPISPLW